MAPLLRLDFCVIPIHNMVPYTYWRNLDWHSMISENVRVYLEDEIVFIDFGEELITADTMKEAIRQHEKLTGIVKCKVIIKGQGALDLDGQIKELSASNEVVNLSEAVAIIPTTKLGYILAALFMKIMKNPYPTEVFYNTDSAKRWLRSL